MKFGKRRKGADAPGAPEQPVPAAASAPPPAADSWTATATAQHERAGAYEQASASAYDEPVVEGEAVELPAGEAPPQEFHQPVPLTLQHHQPAPAAMPFPVADEPVAVVTPTGGSGPVTSLGDSGEAFASGHAAAPGPNWQEPLMELANERPELVVGAAFAGGVLAAMIIRRLGN